MMLSPLPPLIESSAKEKSIFIQIFYFWSLDMSVCLPVCQTISIDGVEKNKTDWKKNDFGCCMSTGVCLGDDDDDDNVDSDTATSAIYTHEILTGHNYGDLSSTELIQYLIDEIVSFVSFLTTID